MRLPLHRRVTVEPSALLLAAAILLPAILFAFAAWSNYRQTLREAESRIERTVRILQEHAVKVFETHRLVIDQVRLRLRFMEWEREADRLDLHRLLEKIQSDFDQIATVTITDPEGRLRASSRLYPADPSIAFADRDWFQALANGARGLPMVSRATIGRQSGGSIFNVAASISTGEGPFPGAIAVSIDRSYFERFYRGIERDFDYNVTLLREGGDILARVPKTATSQLGPEAPFFRYRANSLDAAFTSVSTIDGRPRIYAYRKIGAYPVYVGFSIPIDAALGPWHQNLLTYGFVAALAALALLAASSLAIRQTYREQRAVARWRETAVALEAEASQRASAEAQLRQSQKMEAVGRLTGGVAHDFNNLLTVILGNLDLLRRKLPKDDERSLRLVTNAMDGTTRAATLTHRLLAFSRQQPLNPTQVDANKLVAGMSDLLVRTLGEDIAIQTVPDTGLWPTFADANQLESALLNLAVNARDAMPEGGQLTIQTGNTRLEDADASILEEVKPGDYVMIAVNDTGTGMASDVVANAFEPFFTTKPVGKGTGLGLSQVYGFAKQSGGHVAILSEIDRGTTIKVYLPRLLVAEVESAEPIVDTNAAYRPAAQETILVVEDEDMVRGFSVAVLAEAGYTILEAETGEIALAVIRDHPEIVLLFTDVVLTGSMNGRALADAALLVRPDLRVLFTTGYTRDLAISQSRVDGVLNNRLNEDVDFIGKPFSPDELAAKVHKLLAGAAA